jgi:hypothetical protein
MTTHRSTRLALAAGAAVAVALAVAPAVHAGQTHHGASDGHTRPSTLPGGYRHLVVIYEENHSFDNLYGSWGRVDGQRVDGLSNATTAQKTQVAQDGTPYGCLLQNDVNLTSPSPLPTTCTDAAHAVPASHFDNSWWTVDDYIQPTDTTCPAPGVFAPNGVLNGTGHEQDVATYIYYTAAAGGVPDTFVAHSGQQAASQDHRPLVAAVIQRRRIVPEDPAQRAGQRAAGGGDTHNRCGARDIAPMLWLPGSIETDDSDLKRVAVLTPAECSRHVTAFLQSAPPTAGASGGLRAERERLKGGQR